MKAFTLALVLTLFPGMQSPTAAPAASTTAAKPWPAGLPVYDHIVIVVEENKDFDEIIGSSAAPFINNTLKAEGATLTQMYAEEHNSEGNYFWLFSGSNQDVGFKDKMPPKPLTTSSLGEQIRKDHSFKGYSESLPKIGSSEKEDKPHHYARKHVPWISFSKIPNGATDADSSNLRFDDFPTDFNCLPTIAFVIPNLIHDMHDGKPPKSVAAGDKWLDQNLGKYYQWAKQNNSLLILTFDETENPDNAKGLTDPADSRTGKRNRIVTILAGAHVKQGDYTEGKGVTHVNLLRTLEAMYKLDKSGTQQKNAVKAGITDDFIITDVFEGGSGFSPGKCLAPSPQGH